MSLHQLKSCRILVLLTLLLASPLRADLNSDIRQVLADKLLGKTEVGIELIRVGAAPADDKILFQHNSDIPLTPASNLKLLTTSAALDRLGPDFKFRTQLLFHDGDLILVGDGDPTLGDAELLRKAGWDVNTVFKLWAAELQKRGIKTVRNIYIDDSVFDENFFHPNWPANQQDKRYSAQVSGLCLNANCIDFNIETTSERQPVSYRLNPDTRYVSVRNTCLTGEQNEIRLARQPHTNDIILAGEANSSMPLSISINDPPLYAGTVLAETFRSVGLAVTGSVSRDRTLAAKASDPSAMSQYVPLAVLQTPLTNVMARANKDSMNLYAECLGKRLGHEVTHAPGSWQNGTAAVADFLRRCNISDSEFNLDDGCGLSKQNTISANGIARVLLHDFHSPNRDTFLNTLAVAGVDGTLSDRFRNSDLRNRVFGKSGFVFGVSSLSGYLKAKDNNWYVFSILMNNIPAGSNSGIKPLHEKIVKALDNSVPRAN